MKTGIEIIAKERQEQIEKHGHSIKSDVDFNTENQLVSAIMMMAANIGFVRAGIKMPKEAFEDLRPEGWGREICWGMLSKPIIQQLGIIGAFAAAEIDRLQASQPQQEETEKELEERTERSMNLIDAFCKHLKSEVGLVIPESAVLSFFNA